MVEQVQRMLPAADYVIFALMLLISLLIGVFYAFKDRKSKKGTDGYLMAGRSMTAIPTGISLAVSFQSSVTILGVPNDVYLYGITYIWSLLSLAITFLVVAFTFTPILYNLGISSAYEYLEKRYNKLMRLVSTSLYLITNLLYMGVNIYGPALALSGVTDFELTTAMLSTGLVCAVYTTLGGLRGVIWTDVFQGIIMLMGMLAIIIRGTIMHGGVSKMWEIASAGGRTSSSFNLDPKERYTFGSVLCGSLMLWIGIFGANQAQVQRMLSVKSQKESIKALAVGLCGIGIYSTLALGCGLVTYTFYNDCDPILSGCISKADEVYPFAVTNIFQQIPGLTGLFLACVFSASLSTVSSGVNAMTTVIMADFVKPHTQWSERIYTWVAKGSTLLCGCLALGIGILSSFVGDIVLLGVISASSFTCPCLMVFLLGIWCPFMNAWGALSAIVSSFATSIFIFLGSISVKRHNSYLEISTEKCPLNCDFTMSPNITYASIELPTTPSEVDDLQGIENLYALSLYYIPPFSALVAVFVGVTVSLITGGWKQRHDVASHLMRPPFESQLCSCIPEKIRFYLRCGIDWNVEDVDTKISVGDEFDDKCENRPLKDCDEEKL